MRSWCRVFCYVLLPILGGCGGPLVAEGDPAGSTSGSAEATAANDGSTGPGGPTTTTSEGTDTASSGSDAGSSDGTTAVDPSVCGDGVIEGDEECDDPSASCRTDCTRACVIDMSTDVIGPKGTNLSIHALAVGPNGEIVVAGFTGPAPGEAVATAVFDRDGEQLRFESAEGIGTGFIGDVVMGADAAIHVGTTSDNEAVLVRFGPSPGEQAVVSPFLGDEAASTGAGVALAPDGTVVMSGSVAVGTGDSEIYIYRLAADGSDTFEVLGSMGGPSLNDVGGPLAVASTGTAYIASLVPSPGGGLGVLDPFIVASDSQGMRELWTQGLGATNLQLSVDSVVIDGTGRVIALYNLRHSSNASTHFLVVVLDPDGKPLRTIDSDLVSEPGQFGSGLTTDDLDRVYVGGVRFRDGDSEAFLMALGPRDEVLCDVTWDPDEHGSLLALEFEDDIFATTVSSGPEYQSRLLRLRSL